MTTGETLILATVIIVSWALIVGGVAYWALFGRDINTYREDDHN